MWAKVLASVLASAIAGIVLIASAGASAAAERCAGPPPSLAKFQPTVDNKPAPAEPFVTADGSEQRLAAFASRGLVVNFWATWCAPCVKEMPDLDRLSAEAAGAGIHVLALSADREGAPVVRAFYDKNGITHLAVAIDQRARLAKALGVGGLPTTVLFDAGGREVGRVVGVAKWDAPDAVAFLERCLAAKA